MVGCGRVWFSVMKDTASVLVCIYRLRGFLVGHSAWRNVNLAWLCPAWGGESTSSVVLMCTVYKNTTIYMCSFQSILLHVLRPVRGSSWWGYALPEENTHYERPRQSTSFACFFVHSNLLALNLFSAVVTSRDLSIDFKFGQLKFCDTVSKLGFFAWWRKSLKEEP